MASLTYRQIPARRWAVVGLITTLIGTFLGILGPFGSYLNADPVLRVAFWIGSVWTGLLLYGASLAVSGWRTTPTPRWRAIILVISVLFASVPQTILTRNFAILFWPQLNRLGPSWAMWYAQVTTIALFTVSSYVIFREAWTKQMRRPIVSQITKPDPLLNILRDDVIALHMEDHYVRVHTAARSHLVLMPLEQAIKALAPIEGMRTHRSWWVARHAIDHIDNSARSMRLHLVNGLIAPVSRNAIATLRSAGWLHHSASEVVAGDDNDARELMSPIV